jgi:acyl-CoA thioesterase-2
MGDLAKDTAVSARGEGCYEATLSADWEIWGPMGGYVAACALRAAGEESGGGRPAAFSCHYLSVAAFGPVDLRVVTLREGKSASSRRVEVTQGDRRILEAIVWTVRDGIEGLEHDETTAPDVAGPEGLPHIEELLPEDAQPPFAFWNNLDAKPLQFEVEWPPDGPRPASWQEWLRFRPTASYDDPWVDATRTVILVDLPSWPSAHRPHAWKQPSFTAPTLDLNIAFHRPTAGHDWLLCDGAAPLSTDGLFAWTSRVWSADMQLLASGGGQCLYRPMRQ